MCILFCFPTSPQSNRLSGRIFAGLLLWATLGLALPVQGQTTVPSPVTLDQARVSPTVQSGIAYPTSAQRFFESGQRRLEVEIRQLQAPAPSPALDILPESMPSPARQPLREDR